MAVHMYAANRQRVLAMPGRPPGRNLAGDPEAPRGRAAQSPERKLGFAPSNNLGKSARRGKRRLYEVHRAVYLPGGMLCCSGAGGKEVAAGVDGRAAIAALAERTERWWQEVANYTR